MDKSQYEKYCVPIFSQYKQNIFLVDYRGFMLTYMELEDKVEQCSKRLEKELRFGAAAILGRNTWDFYVTVLSCLKLKRSLFIFNSEWREEQVKNQLEVLNIQNLIRIESDNQTLIEHFNWDKSTVDYKSGIYLATSGTTNQSKWVYQSLEAVFQNLKGLAQTVGLTEADRIHSIIPLYTSNGMTITFFLPFSIGASIFLDKQFSPFSVGTYFKHALENRVTALSLVPSVAAILSKNISSTDDIRNNEHKIRFGICGTAPLKEEDRERFQSKFNIPLYVNYGLTETLFVSSQNAEYCSHTSSGKLLPNMEVIFQDGEIGIKGISVMDGYVGQESIGDIFYTGDLGKYRQDELYITGRKKDIIIRGGYNINPNQIDEYLSRFHEVKECCTFGAASDISGEELYSAVVLDNSQTDAMPMLRQALKRDLPSYMVPKLLLVNRIPRNSAGKPVKRELIEMLGIEIS